MREISKHIDDDMLREIAAADYSLEQDQHFAALLPVRDASVFPEKMHWYPGEVLELSRNVASEYPDWKRSSAGVRRYWIGAFSSAALLRALAEPWNYSGDAAEPNYTLIQLINSCSALSTDFSRPAFRFLAWLLLHSEPEGSDAEVCYYGIGILWFALHLTTPPLDQDLTLLAKWIIRREKEVRQAWPKPSEHWLLGVGVGNSPPSPWELFGLQLFELDLSGHSAELQEWAKLIGQNLVG